ncbi:hypothetical protein B0T14DRAFT_8361 [Immersiella caudata]|uniref:Uncharacterized protein n=1 Tax=Immersiella caudata TaxID=314043 RepID=A0AA40CAZ9_9PEZI|nr:hypothetical protein B0T14DRAFT_8361 [Immersiella caudata]
MHMIPILDLSFVVFRGREAADAKRETNAGSRGLHFPRISMFPAGAEWACLRPALKSGLASFWNAGKTGNLFFSPSDSGRHYSLCQSVNNYRSFSGNHVDGFLPSRKITRETTWVVQSHTSCKRTVKCNPPRPKQLSRCCRTARQDKTSGLWYLGAREMAKRQSVRCGGAEFDTECVLRASARFVDAAIFEFRIEQATRVTLAGSRDRKRVKPGDGPALCRY